MNCNLRQCQRGSKHEEEATIYRTCVKTENQPLRMVALERKDASTCSAIFAPYLHRKLCRKCEGAWVLFVMISGRNGSS
jgi:hypothetical protein